MSTNDWKLPWNGRCRCGKVTLTVTKAPLLTMACHCKGCQRMSASAFSLTAAVPADGFQIEGETVQGGIHGKADHEFCRYCMAWLFTRPEGVDFFVNLRVTMLDDPSWFVPFIETQTAEMLPWAKTPAVHSFARFPEMKQFDGMMKEFAGKAARPK